MDGPLKEKSYQFAIRIVKLSQFLLQLDTFFALYSNYGTKVLVFLRHHL